MNRYNDPARDHYTVPHVSYQKQPMMVIRTYPATTTAVAASQPSSPPTATTAATTTSNAIHSNKHSTDNNNYSHRNYHSHHSHHQYHQQPSAKQSNHHYPVNARRTGALHAGMSTPKNGYNDPMDDDADVMDYRKMNATSQRSGFVKNSAAMWDRRAAQTTTEFNTIVWFIVRFLNRPCSLGIVHFAFIFCSASLSSQMRWDISGVARGFLGLELLERFSKNRR